MGVFPYAFDVQIVVGLVLRSLLVLHLVLTDELQSPLNLILSFELLSCWH